MLVALFKNNNKLKIICSNQQDFFIIYVLFTWSQTTEF